MRTAPFHGCRPCFAPTLGDGKLHRTPGRIEATISGRSQREQRQTVLQNALMDAIQRTAHPFRWPHARIALLNFPAIAQSHRDSNPARGHTPGMGPLSLPSLPAHGGSSSCHQLRPHHASQHRHRAALDEVTLLRALKYSGHRIAFKRSASTISRAAASMCSTSISLRPPCAEERRLESSLVRHGCGRQGTTPFRSTHQHRCGRDVRAYRLALQRSLPPLSKIEMTIDSINGLPVTRTAVSVSMGTLSRGIDSGHPP